MKAQRSRSNNPVEVTPLSRAVLEFSGSLFILFLFIVFYASTGAPHFGSCGGLRMSDKIIRDRYGHEVGRIEDAPPP